MLHRYLLTGLQPRHLLVLIAASVFIAGVTGCTDPHRQPLPTPSAVASPTSTVQATASPSAADGSTRHAQPQAPDGRPADPALNALIEHLLSDDAMSLERRYGSVDARESGGGTAPDRMLPASEWAARLTGNPRSLYAVAPAHPQASPRHDVEIVLAVGPGDTPEGWRFAVSGNDIVDLAILPRTQGAVAGPYEDFLVLPPATDLPKPPAGYAFTAGAPRTGVAGVDALVDALAAHDAGALTAAVAGGPIAAQHCNIQQSLDPADVPKWLASIAAEAYSLRAVVNVPDGYQPPAQHLLIVVLEAEPYRWTQAGLLETDGRIVGILNECVPYPPRAFLVPPPSGGVDTIDASRRSGVRAVDAALDALAAHDRAALTAAIDFSEVGCVAAQSGIGSPPLCRVGEAAGTPLAVLPVASCEGSYARRDELGALLDSLLSVDWRLYAVVDRGPVAPQPGDFFGGRYAAVLAPVVSSVQHGALLLFFSNAGIITVQTGCGQDSPETQLGRAMVNSAPNFLLPPASPASSAPTGDIDTAIAAALAHDAARLAALITPTTGPCVVDPAPAPLRSPECTAGMPAGTPVPAIVGGACPDEPVYFIDPGVTFAPDLDPSGIGTHLIGVIETTKTPARYAALFGYEKVSWLGFDADGHLIGAGGGGGCPASGLRPRLSDARWLRGPDWSE